MPQGALDFTAPIVAEIPIAGSSQMARHASYTGARAVVETWTARQSAYLQVVRNAGAISDQEAAAVLGWQLCSVNSVRGALKQLIVPDGFDAHIWTDSRGRRRTTRRTRWRVRDERELAQRA